MQLKLDRMRAWHHFWLEQALYPIILSTILVLGLYLARIYLSRSWAYQFLPWNIFLAWIPYLCSIAALVWHRRYPRRRQGLVVLSLLWLIFFPNAPYLVTDLVHLDWRHPVPIWHDIVLLVAGIWTGLFLALFSLRTMQQIVADYTGRWLSWFFVAGTFGLTGLGVYLGRFGRWNSWDLLTHPADILADAFFLLSAPLENIKAIGFILQLAAFLFVCYLTLTTTRPTKQI